MKTSFRILSTMVSYFPVYSRLKHTHISLRMGSENTLIKTKEQRLNPHSYRLKGRDFIHQGKIEIDVNERAVFIRTQGCFSFTPTPIVSLTVLRLHKLELRFHIFKGI